MRMATRASLQRPYDDQILTSVQLFEYCREHIHGIDFIFISEEDMEPVRIAMSQLYQIAEKPIPGTRNFHHFLPSSDNTICIKRVSWQDHYDFVFHFGQEQSITRPTPHTCVVCIYDRNWWIGMVLSVNDNEHDA